MTVNPFDDLAADYDRNGAHAARAAALINRVTRVWPDGRPDVIVDVGTGTGAAAFAALAAFPAARITAIDLSPAMIDRARDIADTVPGAERINWIAGDARTMPAQDSSVDLVLCTSSLHFFPAAIFADWRRVLHPGGMAAYTLPLRSTFRPGPAFVDLLPAEQDRIPLADSAAEAANQSVTGFSAVDIAVDDGAVGYVLRRD
ncbi:class I SAM-dependent methyltransferase [Microlunatus soli]|uniref:Methyltransferase domain-containing protein n=1 Tax=Microlunatus soli TaxID=630515 RepID=A0A1H1W2D8_9ACTN|nr:class I SAM-dependent methyltransferase [Microlunatus soli]SDS91287.1 Methyltransferase domain-containing protein [Microlunatus soli]